MQKYIELIKPHIWLNPLISYICVINFCFGLKYKNLPKEKVSFIIISYLCFFGGPLLANCVFQQFLISQELMVCYFAGVFTFMLFKDCEIIGKITKLISVLGRIGMLVNLKYVQQSHIKVITWLISCEMFSLFLKKTLLENSKYIFTFKEVKGLLENIIIIFLMRKFKLPIYFLHTTIILFETSDLLNFFSFKKPRRKSSTKKELTTQSIKTKTSQRRQASIDAFPSKEEKEESSLNVEKNSTKKNSSKIKK